MFSIPLSVILLAASHNFIIDGNYDGAKKIINSFAPNKTNKDEYFYIKSVIAYAENDLSNSKKNIENFNFVSNNNTPYRWKVLIDRMSEDIENWKEGDLHDIDRDMKNVAARLDNAKGGTKTQETQKQIINKLDKLINEMEKQEQDQKAAQAQQSEQNAKDSLPLPDFAGKGTVDEKKLKKLAEEWGKLPPAERAKAIQEINNDLPPKFKPMIEDYLKSLNKYQPKE